MKIKVITGKNFGDEGKGLAVNYFADTAVKDGDRVICARHNGGAQAGHTVDLPDKRFVFSQLSSASFCGVPTYWADSFMPDMYKLTDEAEGFKSLAGYLPDIYADGKCRCTYIDDVLINLMLETSRGDKRHGSCGMGINEAAVRSRTAPLLLGDIMGLSAEALYKRLEYIRSEYTPLRLKELSAETDNTGTYGELLRDKNVLRRAAEAMCAAFEYVKLRPLDTLADYDGIIFEGAQGLMLDELNLEYAPHLTSSRTGLYEPARIIRSLFPDSGRLPETEVIYVTRTYVTRHGRGRLPYEGMLDPAAYGITDRTNIENEWQEALRFAPHGGYKEFTAAVQRDLAENALPSNVSLMITHLNETEGRLVTKDGRIPVSEFCTEKEISSLFGQYYLSYSPTSVQHMTF